MKVLQINTSVNSGSTGRIAESIGQYAIESGGKSYIAYGFASYNSTSVSIKVGNKGDIILHVIKTRLFDRHGFGSTRATKILVTKIEHIEPDLIHLHNIHGYYINIRILFEYLKKKQIPIIWTFHDCWPFTGHCCYFDRFNCNKWMTGCFNCPNTQGYPQSWLIDNSKQNYQQKKKLFTGINKMTLVSPSEWLASHLKKSYLSKYTIKIIYNGVDLNCFSQIYGNLDQVEPRLRKKYILGVASVWSKRKGLDDFLKLRDILDKELEIVIVGLTHRQIKSLPPGIRGIHRTGSIRELGELYSKAEVFVNPTYVDNFPTTNLEALACGTPVVTYDTGGSSESVSTETGRVVKKGDLQGLKSAITELLNSNRLSLATKCNSRAKELYDSRLMSSHYYSLYCDVLGLRDTPT